MAYEWMGYQVVRRVQLDLAVHMENFPVRRFQHDLLALSSDNVRSRCGSTQIDLLGYYRPIPSMWRVTSRAKEGFQPALIIKSGNSPETRPDALTNGIGFSIRRRWPQDTRFVHRQTVIRYNVLKTRLGTLLVRNLPRQGLTVAVFE